MTRKTRLIIGAVEQADTCERGVGLFFEMVRITVTEVERSLKPIIDRLMNMAREGKTPETESALLLAAQHIVAKKWKDYLLGGEIEGTPYKVKNPSGASARSIKVKRLSRFSYLVFSQKKTVEWLEKGTKEVDFKKTHPYGRKSRVSAKGIPYLIVPFRHGNPKAIRNPMPSPVYNLIRSMIKTGEFVRSRVNPAKGYQSPNFAGEMVQRQGYNWGSRLEGLAQQFRNLEGLVVFPGEAPGERSRSQYFTFRIISAKSPPESWIKPATPALNLTKHVQAATETEVAEIVAEGMRRDLDV